VREEKESGVRAEKERRELQRGSRRARYGGQRVEDGRSPEAQKAGHNPLHNTYFGSSTAHDSIS
jgi:hypothetical protein